MGRNATVRAVFGGQALVTLVSAATWWFASGTEAALAALAGGGIALIPGLYLAVTVFSVPPDAPPKRVLGAFYRGEAVKFGLTALLFIITLQWFASVFAPVIATYILALLVYWLALRVGVTDKAVNNDER